MTFSHTFAPPIHGHACFLKPYGGGVCGAKWGPCYLPSLSRSSKRFWKNYSDICMNRGSKAPGGYPLRSGLSLSASLPPPRPPALITAFINTANCALPPPLPPFRLLHILNQHPGGTGTRWAGSRRVGLRFRIYPRPPELFFPPCFKQYWQLKCFCPSNILI